MNYNNNNNDNANDNKQLLEEVFVISAIIKVKESTNRGQGITLTETLIILGYHKNRINY